MKTNAIATPTLIQTPSMMIESKLGRMKKLQAEIKMRTAEFDMLKKEVVHDYLATYHSYKTSKGLELATYKPQEMTQFQQSKFKVDHADIYNMYCEKITIFKFLLK